MAALSRCPRALWRPVARGAGVGLSLARRWGRAPRPVRQWCLNVSTLTGAQPEDRVLVAAVVSWARTLVTSMQLPRWSGARIDAAVDIDPQAFAALRRLHLETGVVLALPHMGSWDLAGAWVSRRGMRVATVAEHLPPRQFEAFSRARRALGMTVHALDSRPLAALLDDAERGEVVALVADRDFSRRGVPVVWRGAAGPVPGSMPGGPAHIALTRGAALVGVACHYSTPERMRIELSGPLTTTCTDHDEAVADLTGQLAHWFASAVRAHPHDWHMFQPVFTGVRA